MKPNDKKFLGICLAIVAILSVVFVVTRGFEQGGPDDQTTVASSHTDSNYYTPGAFQPQTQVQTQTQTQREANESRFVQETWGCHDWSETWSIGQSYGRSPDIGRMELAYQIRRGHCVAFEAGEATTVADRYSPYTQADQLLRRHGLSPLNTVAHFLHVLGPDGHLYWVFERAVAQP